MDSAAESKQPDVADGAAMINLLRRFHFGEPAAAESTAVPAGAILPALLNPYRDTSAIRYQYPLYLVPRAADGDTELARPLSEHLSPVCFITAFDGTFPFKVTQPSFMRWNILMGIFEKLIYRSKARITPIKFEVCHRGPLPILV